MTHDPPKGVVRFTNGTDEIAYKMPHKIEQYTSLSDLKIEHTKSVYLRNEEDKIRGVEYVMSKILGFYKECLELGPDYATGIAVKEKSRRKAHLLEDKQLPSVRVFDEVSFYTLLQDYGPTPNLEEVLLTERGDGVAGIKRRRRDPSSDGIRDLVTTSGHS
ncbi:hypothetical protein Tco_0233181 [Tanacetum coccineum]